MNGTALDMLGAMRSLRSLFHTAVTMTLTASCGGGEVRDSIDRTELDLTLCENGSYNSVSGVTEANQHDYLELRSEELYTKGSGPVPVHVVDKDGTPCATATTTTCSDTLTTLRTGKGWGTILGGTIQYLVYTRGDDVGAITSVDAVPAFVAPVDTVKDAALILSTKGHRIVCDGRPNGRQTASGWEIVTETGFSCGGGGVFENVVAVDATGAYTVKKSVNIVPPDDNCAIGRRPEGLAPSDVGGKGIGAFFACAARLEAASIVAFERLAEELRAHGAPDDLVREALRAARDEVRHARLTKAIAARYGATVVDPSVGDCPVRTLFAVALENAVEGCVRETFGALVATYQSKNASDPRIARAMATIAEDETRHADLAWRIAEWAETHLDDEQRAWIRAARTQAAADLHPAIAREPDPELTMAAGMPTAHDALTLFAVVAPDLWAA